MLYHESMSNSPNPREVLELAAEIVRTEETLTELKRKWDGLFGITETAPTSKSVGGRPVRENSVASQVLMLIDSQPSKQWDTESICRTLRSEKEPVASALYNLFVAKKVNRVDRGKYQSKLAWLTPTTSTEEAA